MIKKTLFTIVMLGFLFATNKANAQNSQYSEFSTTNFTLFSAEKFIPEGSTIRYITDNTDPSNVKTYIFYQGNSVVPNYVPQVPADWSTYEAEFKQDITLKFRTEGVVKGILTENYSYYIRIN
tara:strand:+ start:164 stop:532 length:369 start_codon:yes stop_codon:yes gene_type:complete